jgi:hypothetical protein
MTVLLRVAAMAAIALLAACGPRGDPSTAEEPAPADGDIKQACDDAAKSYWSAKAGSERDVTVFVTNTCKCVMTVTVKGKDLKAPQRLEIASGQTKSTSVKKASDLSVACAKGEGECTGAYQFWN